MPLHPPLYVPPPEDTPIPGVLFRADLGFAKPRRQSSTTSLSSSKMSKPRTSKNGTHVAPLRYRFGSCDEEQNTPKWSHLNVSPWLTAILAVLSRTGVECGQPSVRSSVQRKMGGGQATSKEAPYRNAGSLNYRIFIHAYYATNFCPFPLPL